MKYENKDPHTEKVHKTEHVTYGYNELRCSSKLSNRNYHDSNRKKGWLRRNKPPVSSPLLIMNLLVFILNYSLIDHRASEYIVSVVYSRIHSLCILCTYTDCIYRLFT